MKAPLKPVRRRDDSTLGAVAGDVRNSPISLLSDGRARPRSFAAIALARLSMPHAWEPLVACLARDGGDRCHRGTGRSLALAMRRHDYGIARSVK
jgi:hypothetical protein